MVHHPTSRRGLLIGTVLLLAVLAILPARYGRWTDGLGAAAILIVAPVSQPVRQTTAWLMGDPGAHDPTVVQQLQQERDTFRTLWLQSQDRVARLERDIADLQRGAVANELRVQQISRPVILRPSDGRGGELTVRAGMRDGVEVNVVATTSGVQLAGRIVTAHARSSTLQLITSKAAGKITGVVMSQDDLRGPKVLLSPIGESRLQGYVEYGGGEVTVGQTVRLEDEQWPRSARMLVIGQVTEVERGIDGRQRVIVKPTVELERLGEVVLRLNPVEESERLVVDPKRSTDGARP